METVLCQISLSRTMALTRDFCFIFSRSILTPALETWSWQIRLLHGTHSGSDWQSKTTEGIVRVFLSPILPGLTVDLPSLFCSAVGLMSTQPVILSFRWTQLLIAGNLGDLLRVDYIAQYGLTIPQEMIITGISPLDIPWQLRRCRSGLMSTGLCSVSTR